MYKILVQASNCKVSLVHAQRLLGAQLGFSEAQIQWVLSVKHFTNVCVR